jgi:hypothetical protein
LEKCIQMNLIEDILFYSYTIFAPSMVANEIPNILDATQPIALLIYRCVEYLS